MAQMSHGVDGLMLVALLAVGMAVAPTSPPRRASRGRRRHPLPSRREPIYAAVRGPEVL